MDKKLRFIIFIMLIPLVLFGCAGENQIQDFKSFLYDSIPDSGITALSEQERSKKAIIISTTDAPALENGISLSVFGIEIQSDENNLIGYTWIDNKAIALFVSAGDNLRIYEIDLETGTVSTINTEISAPANVKKYKQGFVCEYREDTSKFVFLNSSYVLTDTIEYDDSILHTKPYWEWRIAYSTDYKKRAFCHYERLYIQNAGETDAVIICDELFPRSDNDEPAYYLLPVCFAENGDKLICTEESIYIDGTSDGAIRTTTSSGGLIVAPYKGAETKDH